MRIPFGRVVATITASAILSLASTARAEVLFTSLSAWQTAIGSWSETTNFGVADLTDITAFTTVDGVSIAAAGNVRSVGNGWSTWCCGYTGQVLWSGGPTVMNFTLASGVKGFGLFAEPERFTVQNITLTTSTGASVTQAVNGQGGAAFFGWVGPGVTSFQVNSATDFAVGDVFSATGAIPEPATWALMLFGFGGAGALLRRRRQIGIRMIS